MQCEFNMHGGGINGSDSIRGGYPVDKKNPRLNSYYVPIGLHTHGEDSFYEDPLDEFSMEYHDHPIMDQGHIDQMLYIVTVSSKKANKSRNKTRKHKSR